MTTLEGFGRLRAFFWPIHSHELKKFIPMLLIFFLVGFNYNLLRIAKDAFIITAPSSGAEAIPFIKVWGTLPMALLFTFIFTRISNRVSRERVFYGMISIFLLFFLLFACVLYPYNSQLHPHQLADRLEGLLPQGLGGLVAIFRNWTFTLFYVMAEMWSPFIMTVLAWGFANEVTSVNDAKRFYVPFSISINLAAIVAGKAIQLLSRPIFGTLARDASGQSIFVLTLMLVVAGVGAMVLFRYLHRLGYGYNSSGYLANNRSSEIKMGMRKNFAYVARSKYLVCIAIVVVMYNVTLNLTEVVWWDQLKQIHPHLSDYNTYMGNVLIFTGIVSTLLAFFAGSIIRRCSWTTSAMITPLIVLVTSIGFFAFLLSKEQMGYVAQTFGGTLFSMGAFFGSSQNCLMRSAKYTLFDNTKELAFIPLSQECKMKGKAAIDGIGSRIGKSGGALIYQALLMGFGTVSLSTPYVAVILLGIIGMWMLAVRSLGRQFSALQSQSDTPVIAEVSPERIPS